MFHENIDGMLQELTSRLCQLACGDTGFIIRVSLKSQDLVPAFSEDSLYLPPVQPTYIWT